MRAVPRSTTSRRCVPGGPSGVVDLGSQHYSDPAKWKLLSSAYGVSLDAQSTSSITALVGAAAGAVGIGKVGLAGAMGVSLARNLIGWKPVRI